MPLSDFNSNGDDISEILIFGGIGGSETNVTDSSAIVRINNNDFSQTLMYLLNEEKEVEKEQPQGITQEHDRTEPNEEEVREELFKVKRHECMKARDRFFFNQFFPIRHEHLSE